MKKIFILLLSVFLITGCFSKSDNSLDKALLDLSEAKSYEVIITTENDQFEGTNNINVKTDFISNVSRSYILLEGAGVSYEFETYTKKEEDRLISYTKTSMSDIITKEIFEPEENEEGFIDNYSIEINKIIDNYEIIETKTTSDGTVYSIKFDSASFDDSDTFNAIEEVKITVKSNQVKEIFMRFYNENDEGVTITYEYRDINNIEVSIPQSFIDNAVEE
jgi:uncharacterized protein YcfL